MTRAAATATEAILNTPGRLIIYAPNIFGKLISATHFTTSYSSYGVLAVAVYARDKHSGLTRSRYTAISALSCRIGISSSVFALLTRRESNRELQRSRRRRWTSTSCSTGRTWPARVWSTASWRQNTVWRARDSPSRSARRPPKNRCLQRRNTSTVSIQAVRYHWICLVLADRLKSGNQSVCLFNTGRIRHGRKFYTAAFSDYSDGLSRAYTVALISL